MSEDASVSETRTTAVVREPRIGTPPAPDKFRLDETATLAHRGAHYRAELVADDTWDIQDEDGRTLGSVFIVSASGEEGEAVYAGRVGASGALGHEGTDWRSVAAAVINEALDA